MYLPSVMHDLAIIVVDLRICNKMLQEQSPLKTQLTDWYVMLCNMILFSSQCATNEAFAFAIISWRCKLQNPQSLVQRNNFI